MFKENNNNILVRQHGQVSVSDVCLRGYCIKDLSVVFQNENFDDEYFINILRSIDADVFNAILCLNSEKNINCSLNHAVKLLICAMKAFCREELLDEDIDAVVHNKVKDYVNTYLSKQDSNSKEVSLLDISRILKHLYYHLLMPLESETLDYIRSIDSVKVIGNPFEITDNILAQVSVSLLEKYNGYSLLDSDTITYEKVRSKRIPIEDNRALGDIVKISTSDVNQYMALKKYGLWDNRIYRLDADGWKLVAETRGTYGLTRVPFKINTLNHYGN